MEQPRRSASRTLGLDEHVGVVYSTPRLVTVTVLQVRVPSPRVLRYPLIGELASYSGPAAQARATQANYTSNLYSIRVTVRSHRDRHGDSDRDFYSRELLPSQDYYAAGPGSELHTCFPCIAQMPPCRRIYELLPTVRALNRRYLRYRTSVPTVPTYGTGRCRTAVGPACTSLYALARAFLPPAAPRPPWRGPDAGVGCAPRSRSRRAPQRARWGRARRRVSGFVVMAKARLAQRQVARAVRADTLLSTVQSIQRSHFPTRRAVAAGAAPSTPRPRLMSAARVGRPLLTFRGDGYG